MIEHLFENLIKTNGGKFVSEKQACFMLGECTFTPENGYSFCDMAEDGTSSKTYLCDSTGIVVVLKSTAKRQSNIWTRPEPGGERSIQDQLAINKLLRKLNKARANTVKINALWQSGTYQKVYEPDRYISYFKEDLRNNLDLIKMLKQQLEALGYEAEDQG